MNSLLCTDIGWLSLNKHGEQLCGDHVEIVEADDGAVVAVLADGLGSGVKANILSTLTAKIISTMMANAMSIEECVATIAATLPVCELRGIAYSTFTIIRVSASMVAEVIEYDNPDVILLRGGKSHTLPRVMECIDGKAIYKSRLHLQLGDTFVAVSDGAIHAGVGKSLNFGWQRDNIVEFMELMYDGEFTAKTLSSMLLEQCLKLYGGEPGDDTTVCTLRVRERRPVNLMIGPPADPADLGKMMMLFFSKQGKHIVCGGTTSTLAAEYLGKELEVGLPIYVDPEIPPTAKIQGVELVTEGVITINKVLQYAQDYLGENRHYLDWSCKKDGASQIARMLFEDATDINFYVGRAVNSAHQNPDLPIGFSIKMHLIGQLAESLQAMGKKIKVSYF